LKKTESISNQISTLKSCVGVALVGAALAGGFLLIRLVGEERLQRFLEYFYLRIKGWGRILNINYWTRI